MIVFHLFLKRNPKKKIYVLPKDIKFNTLAEKNLICIPVSSGIFILLLQEKSFIQKSFIYPIGEQEEDEVDDDDDEEEWKRRRREICFAQVILLSNKYPQVCDWVPMSFHFQFVLTSFQDQRDVCHFQFTCCSSLLWFAD